MEGDVVDRYLNRDAVDVDRGGGIDALCGFQSRQTKGLLVALELGRVVAPSTLAHVRRIAIVIIVVVSAIITPSSDPFSMLAMAVPMLIFYEMAIVIGRVGLHHGNKMNEVRES